MKFETAFAPAVKRKGDVLQETQNVESHHSPRKLGGGTPVFALVLYALYTHYKSFFVSVNYFILKLYICTLKPKFHLKELMLQKYSNMASIESYLL